MAHMYRNKYVYTICKGELKHVDYILTHRSEQNHKKWTDIKVLYLISKKALSVQITTYSVKLKDLKESQPGLYRLTKLIN